MKISNGRRRGDAPPDCGSHSVSLMVMYMAWSLPGHLSL